MIRALPFEETLRVRARASGEDQPPSANTCSAMAPGDLPRRRPRVDPTRRHVEAAGARKAH
eukprot:4360797-Pyramimonas_sp.AAC.1